MFKLLALRVLDGCADHIKKCLKPNVYYYFCSDFRFEDEGKIYRGNKYTKPLPEDLYTIPKIDDNNPSSNPVIFPTINVNAIVGKNGDGKSTIVEIIIRLINNHIAYRQELGDFSGNQDLLHVEKVYAELYFQIDQTIYKLFEKPNGQYGLWAIASIEEFHKSNILYIATDKEIEAPDIFKSIYTFVSNYSHYAYNVHDFSQEWEKPEYSVTEEEENNACWLYRAFHKSDGYLTPIALHPYRLSGDLNINLEKSLAQQRLLSLFINANNTDFSFRNVFEKTAFAIKFKDPGSSKLQEITLKKFLLSTWMEDKSLDWALDDIKDIKNIQLNKSNYKKILEHLQYRTLNHVQALLGNLTGLNSIEDSPYGEFMEKMNIYIRENMEQCLPHKKHGKYKEQKSNISSYVTELNRLRKHLKQINLDYSMTEPILHTKLLLLYKSFFAYNTNQLARMRLIYLVATYYHIDPMIIIKSYEKLSEYEKCQHYIIYKVISIFHKYPNYTKFIGTNRSNENKPYEISESELEQLFSQLEDNISKKSHITKKLSQAIFYIQDEENKRSDLYRERTKHEHIRDCNDSEFYILLSDLKGDRLIIKPNELPPAIYDYEIVFRNKDGSISEMSVLSSGEKQLLNTIGAIIYHIQNIESTHSYNTINLILEEIELYFHPDYQRLFIYRLLKQIYGADLKHIKNINITFVTHSPFILSDIPKCNVLFLNNGEPDYTMQENTFGANIHSMLKNAFFLPNLLIGEFAYQKINELFRQLNGYQYRNTDIASLKQKNNYRRRAIPARTTF